MPSIESIPLIESWKDSVELSGTLPEHAHCFQEVSNKENCVIMMRCVGPLVTGLLREGYTTKSISIKTKSCNWGPMAGFVCLDSRLGKMPISLENMHIKTETSHPINTQSVESKPRGFIPILISTTRIRELVKLWRERKDERPQGIRPLGKAEFAFQNPCVNFHEDFFCEAYPPGWEISQKTVVFKLVYIPMLNLWKIKYHSMQAPPPLYCRRIPIFFSEFTEKNDVMSLVDPYCPEEIFTRPGCLHLGATIADYDLFSVLGRQGSKSEQYYLDKRVVSGSPYGNVGQDIFNKEMNEITGNTTPRIEKVIESINREARRKIVHHGDEAGLVGVRKMNFPIVCFVPDYILRDIQFKRSQRSSPFYGARSSQTRSSSIYKKRRASTTELLVAATAALRSQNDVLDKFSKSYRLEQSSSLEVIPACAEFQHLPAFYVGNVNAYKSFLKLLFPYNFRLDFNPGWWNQLGVTRSLHYGSWEVI